MDATLNVVVSHQVCTKIAHSLCIHMAFFIHCIIPKAMQVGPVAHLTPVQQCSTCSLIAYIAILIAAKTDAAYTQNRFSA